MISINIATEDQFDYFMKCSHDDYIEGVARTLDLSIEQARIKADAQLASILAEGFKTGDHHFYVAEWDRQAAGFIWYHIKTETQTKSAWIYNLFVEEQFQKKGIATRLIQHMEQELKRASIFQIGLHVFADNHKARALYDKIGFQSKSVVMSKTLN